MLHSVNARQIMHLLSKTHAFSCLESLLWWIKLVALCDISRAIDCLFAGAQRGRARQADRQWDAKEG